jgi:hypothetical protein
MVRHVLRTSAELKGMDMEKLLLTVEETRQHLGGKGRGYVYQLLADNCIDSVKLGRSRMIVSESLERFVDSLTRASKGGL